jgi:hypothetical protein
MAKVAMLDILAIMQSHLMAKLVGAVGPDV